MAQLSIPKAVEELNQLSFQRWGEKAPRYFFTVRAKASHPRTYFIHRILADISPYIPADELWARGSRDHCLAKLRSAIRYASTPSSPLS
jgi:hypothetical protein